MAHHRHASSASSNAPILINPTLPATPHPAGREPILRYPYPLLVAALLDAGYTIHHTISFSSPLSVIFGLSVIRFTVLAGVMGLSRGWRDRGGWIAVVCGMTVGLSVWKVCEGQLTQGNKSRGGQEETPVDVTFLAITAGIAIAEYLLFLLLLRLSPPAHRLHPLALRVPASAVQSPTVFDYPSQSVAGYASPSSVRYTRHSRLPSQRLSLLSSSVPIASSSRDEHFDSSLDTADRSLEEDDYDDEGGYDETFSETSSSISESSIIDLPPPLSPARIVPPATLSVNRGLNLYAAIDSSPVSGAVVRRTRSARFLGRSWGSRNDEGDGSREGYGTFGGRAGGGRDATEMS